MTNFEMTDGGKISLVPVVIKRTYTVPPQRVFDAWTEPKQMKRWFAPNDEITNPFIEVDLKVGGRYRIAFQSPDGKQHIVGGTYRAIQPVSKLVFTWTWEQPHEFPSIESLVTLDFREIKEGTELVLTHERLLAGDMQKKHTQGWCGCLERLGKI